MRRQRPYALSLLAPRQDRAAHQAREIDARRQHRAQLTQVGRDLVERPPLVGEIEQGGGVTLSQAGDARRFGGQLNAVPNGRTGERAAAAFPLYRIAAKSSPGLKPQRPAGLVTQFPASRNYRHLLPEGLDYNTLVTSARSRERSRRGWLDRWRYRNTARISSRRVNVSVNRPRCL